MAAGPFVFYDSFSKAIGDGTQDLDTHAFKVALFTGTYTPNAGTQTTFSTLTGQVSAGAGYTAGGATLANVTWDQTSGTATFDADDTVWTASGGPITAQYAVVYNSTVAGAGDLVGYFILEDSGGAQDVTATDGNTLTLQWNASGIFTLAPA
jgi:hypothetical protein